MLHLRTTNSQLKPRFLHTHVLRYSAALGTVFVWVLTCHVKICITTVTTIMQITTQSSRTISRHRCSVLSRLVRLSGSCFSYPVFKYSIFFSMQKIIVHRGLCVLLTSPPPPPHTSSSIPWRSKNACDLGPNGKS